LRLTALLVIALLLAACSRAPGLERLATGESGRAVEIRSGDTLVLDNGLAVRLAGVEAPKGDEPYARQAFAALSRLADGRQVQLLYGGARRDRYGRALAQVKLKTGGRWIERELLRSGAVRTRTWPDNRAMAATMLEDEAYARNRKLGLWALPAYRVLIPQETGDKQDFQIIEGRPRGVAPYGDGVRLRFDAGLEAVIGAKALEDFKTAGKAPQKLLGRLVRVRGPLRYGALQLDHPEQLELLKTAN
jgi:micrococcal nuclease